MPTFKTNDYILKKKKTSSIDLPWHKTKADYIHAHAHMRISIYPQTYAHTDEL